MRTRTLCFVTLALITGSLTAGTAEAAQQDTILVSRAGGFGPVANDDSTEQSISADGRYIAFHSTATNLTPDSAGNAFFDVFVRDAVSNTTTLVSRSSGASGSVGDSASGQPSISADGRYVAFDSVASNLDLDSNDSVTDVFVHDLVSNTTTLVSRATGANGAVGDDSSSKPSISADGRYVAFESFATNLDPDANILMRDIFVRDLVSNTTTLASRATGATGAVANGHSFNPSISADGRYVAISSTASNLGPDNTATSDIFVRDLTFDITTLVSRASGAIGAFGDGDSLRPSISADGGYVAFDSAATTFPGDTDAATDIFVRDLNTDTTTLVSRSTGAGGAKGNQASGSASISADGRFVAFDSVATNLPDDTDAPHDVFVRDLAEATTSLVSRAAGAAGASADQMSVDPSITANGRFVAFWSHADNLDGDSDDSVIDVFLRDVLGPQAPPALEINDVTLKEGRSGTTLFNFTVSLDGTPGRTITVDFATKNGTATRADNDYEFTNGTLTFLPGETTKTIAVTVNGDNKREPTENFKVKIFNATAEVEDGTGIGTIKADEKRRR